MLAALRTTLPAEPLTAPADELVSAFEDLRQPLLRALLSLLGNCEDAEDALQTAFVRCWQARAALPQIRNLRAWVWRISMNVGRDLLDYTRRRRFQPLTRIEATAPSSAASPVDNVAMQEDEDRLNAALHSLRAEEKDVFVLRQTKFLTYGEIAQLRGSPIGSVKTLMHGAVQKLRGKLREHIN